MFQNRKATKEIKDKIRKEKKTRLVIIAIESQQQGKNRQKIHEEDKEAKYIK